MKTVINNERRKSPLGGQSTFLFFPRVYVTVTSEFQRTHIFCISHTEIGKQDSQNFCYCVPWDAILIVIMGKDLTIENSKKCLISKFLKHKKSYENPTASFRTIILKLDSEISNYVFCHSVYLGDVGTESAEL